VTEPVRDRGQLAARGRRGERLSDIRVIDVHGHLGDWCKVRMVQSRAQNLVARMDSIGIDTVCVSAFLSITADWQLGNDLVADAIREFPGRFIGYATINPNYPESVLSELCRCFDDLGMRGLKFHPAWHGCPIDAPPYGRAIQFAEDRGAFVLSHDWGDPAHLEGLAGRYQKVSFVVAHLAYLPREDALRHSWAAVVRDCPNVYADLASSIAPMGGFEALVDMVGARKVLYGSDAPLHDMAYQIGRVLFAKMSDEDKADILGHNLERLIGQVTDTG